MKHTILTIAIIILIGLSGYLGMLLKPDRIIEVPGQVIVQEKRVEVEKAIFIDRIRYVERSITVPITIVDIAYKNLQDWNSLEELKAFLLQDDTNSRIILIADSSGNIPFEGQCEDYALQLRDRASSIGKSLEITILDYNMYEKWSAYLPNGKLKDGNYHAVNMAIIGNEVWFIEPQNDNCWLVAFLD